MTNKKRKKVAKKNATTPLNKHIYYMWVQISLFFAPSVGLFCFREDCSFFDGQNNKTK